MVKRKKIIAVDDKFFKDIFEKQRVELQNQLGIRNLSQPNFTKMIVGLKMMKMKDYKIKKGKKKNGEIYRI